MRGLENKEFSKLLLFMDYFLLTKADALPGSFWLPGHSNSP